MNLVGVLTAAAEGAETAPEAVEEATNFFQQAGDWLNSNTGIVAVICTGTLLVAAVLIAYFRKKGRK